MKTLSDDLENTIRSVKDRILRNVETVLSKQLDQLTVRRHVLQVDKEFDGLFGSRFYKAVLKRIKNNGVSTYDVSKVQDLLADFEFSIEGRLLTGTTFYENGFEESLRVEV